MHFKIALLGDCARDHNETLAYIYFTERWTDAIAQRDPLRDRYIIVFFSAEDKLTRMFSNVRPTYIRPHTFRTEPIIVMEEGVGSSMTSVEQLGGKVQASSVDLLIKRCSLLDIDQRGAVSPIEVVVADTADDPLQSCERTLCPTKRASRNRRTDNCRVNTVDLQVAITECANLCLNFE